MTKKKPAASKSAAQARAKKIEAPEPEIPVIAVGDQVRVRATAQHPVIKRGVVTKIEGIAISVRIDGYVVRYRDHQLVKVV